MNLLLLPELELVLQEEEVVRCRHGDNVFMRVPRGVKDLLVEVQTVDVDFILLSLAAGAHLRKWNIVLDIFISSRHQQQTLLGTGQQ